METRGRGLRTARVAVSAAERLNGQLCSWWLSARCLAIGATGHTACKGHAEPQIALFTLVTPSRSNSMTSQGSVLIAPKDGPVL